MHGKEWNDLNLEQSAFSKKWRYWVENWRAGRLEGLN